MNTIAQSEVFFIISSVGFVTLWILAAIFLVYLIRIMHTLSGIIDKIDRGIDNIDDTIKETILDIKDSAIFRFIFGKKRRSRSK